MLVSLAITLIMMGAVVTLFGTISASVSNSRSIIEISERLRATRNRLQTDLQGATATMKPPLRPENDEGYFEYIEGPQIDAGNLPATGTPTQAQIMATAFGDTDDVLMFTVRSRGEPFVGKFDNTTFESQTAEVMYFCAPARNSSAALADSTLFIDPTTGNAKRTLTLYRRVLLVNPGIAQSGSFNPDPEPSPNNFFELYDLSARVQTDSTGTDKMVPNSLGDLTKRENRFAHYGAFPFQLNVSPPADLGGGYLPPARFPKDSSAFLVPFFAGNSGGGVPASPRYGDDVLLTNVLSFDVQVYDPAAPVEVSASAALTPNDPAYSPSGSVLGAYANLGWAPGYPGPLFNLQAEQSYAPDLAPQPLLSPHLPSYPSNIDTSTDPPISSGTSLTRTYDTWSMHYENNGIDDDDSGGLIDEGTNGLDDDTDGIVDDADEFETRPPFAAQLRGIRVTIRVYEPSSQQIRQVTVVGDFLPD
jgi:hypothetical protein